MNYFPAEIIRKKRNGLPLSGDEIGFFVRQYVAGKIPDYQMSAFLMAVFFKGMNRQEMVALVESMKNSGSVLKLDDVDGFKLDKHSTGGVGDKISLILAPVLASLGIYVPMISGRGLAHSGGTLDKLEAIPGLNTRISLHKFREILLSAGFVIAGQTEELVPADRKIYALRDATATIESLPLVVASIMSKKLAEDLDGLVLDVKTGKGAFFPDKNDALQLAGNLITVGKDFDVNVRALLTNMDQPVGMACGNWVEVVEAVDCLTGNGPQDTMTEVFALATDALQIAGIGWPETDMQAKLQDAIDSGTAMEQFLHYVKMMGGDTRVLEKLSRYALVKPVVVKAERTGFVAELDARQIGIAAMLAGAGRKNAEDIVDPDAGILLKVKIGDFVRAGEPVAELFSNQPDLSQVVAAVQEAVRIGDKKPEPYQLIFGEISPEGELIISK
ncbi:MAG TPA: thymidine phosphorylase [Bacteroidetes bacterium]|nr:thymidine phosphorylase [Bacteroidota bacterium]